MSAQKPPWWPGIWFYGPRPFYGIRRNVLPWLGSDGTHEGVLLDQAGVHDVWCRQTAVIPLFGLGAIIIGLPWHRLTQCCPELLEEIH